MTKHLFNIASLFVVWACTVGSAAAQTSYVLGPQDVVNVTVFGEPDLSRKYTIEQDGTFTFPLIGRVTARGLTLRELEAGAEEEAGGRRLPEESRGQRRGRRLPEPANHGAGGGQPAG